MLTNAETALAGLLSESPKHPYQIEKDVEFRDMRYWTDLSMSSIYKTLKKMEKEGLVSSENSISEGNRLRKVYSLTDSGKEALRESVRTALVNPDVQKHPVNVALYFMGSLPRNEIVSSLETYLSVLNERSECYLQLEKFMKDNGCTPEHLTIASRLRIIHIAESEWLQKLIDSYRSETD